MNSKDYTKSWMTEMKDRLVSITSRCNEEMHEPDNEGVSATVVGDHLDNAFGDSILSIDSPKCPQEYVVVLLDTKGRKENFNLSSLIALARKAQI